MQVQVKGQDYFLAFVEQENRFYVFAPSPTGTLKIPVYVDVERWERFGQPEKRTPRVQ